MLSQNLQRSHLTSKENKEPKGRINSGKKLLFYSSSISLHGGQIIQQLSPITKLQGDNTGKTHLSTQHNFI